MRYGDALAWVETSTEAEAVRRSLGLHPLGDWTDDARNLVVFPQDTYPDNTGPHDYTRAVLKASPAPRRRRARPHSGSPGAMLACLAAVLVLAIGLVSDGSAETWRGLTVAPESRCSPYDKKRDCPYPQSVERDIVRELGASHGQDTCPRCRARNIEGICAFDRHRSTSFYVKYENEKSISYGKFHASGVRALHGPVLCIYVRHGHRTHRRCERGPRFRTLRSGPGDEGPILPRPPQPCAVSAGL